MGCDIGHFLGKSQSAARHILNEYAKNQSFITIYSRESENDKKQQKKQSQKKVKERDRERMKEKNLLSSEFGYGDQVGQRFLFTSRFLEEDHHNWKFLNNTVYTV